MARGKPPRNNRKATQGPKAETWRRIFTILAHCAVLRYTSLHCDSLRGASSACVRSISRPISQSHVTCSLRSHRGVDRAATQLPGGVGGRHFFFCTGSVERPSSQQPSVRRAPLGDCNSGAQSGREAKHTREMCIVSCVRVACFAFLPARFA